MSAKVLEPKIFFGKEGEDSSRWMKRYECFRKACKWSDTEATDYLDLFLEGRSLNWYKGFIINNSDWEVVKAKFLEVFTEKDEEATSWNELIKFNSAGKDSIEISGLLTHLFSKAKIVSESEKLKYLMKSLDSAKRRKILESGAESFESALDILTKEEKYDKLIGDHENEDSSTKKLIKDLDNMDTLIKRFDSLSLNLLNRERELDKYLHRPVERPNYRTSQNFKCFNCNQYGHRMEQCRYLKTLEGNVKNSEMDKPIEGNRTKEIHCFDVQCEGTEIFAAEKRPITEDSASINKKVRVFDNEIDKDIKTKKHPVIQSRKPAVIKLSSNSEPYSIGLDLANSKADLSYSQLLQVAPSVRSELIGLCKRQDTKEINQVDFDDSMSTNCRGLVKLFGERYWVILDTGAACSVMTSAFMNDIGLEIEQKSDQTIITADGTKHRTMGSVSSLPITIANFSFTTSSGKAGSRRCHETIYKQAEQKSARRI
ncbi:hypothetical protein AYI69_g11340 [Smittium culicis]|uniref:CCHC-type domain-containing protein n=1 Tax=Smittium culicis TaxID=133412 RepID=A0A1R1WZE4_9FUNG|nr:hypothetical protein AYI69_g11340 [Smittium culicis]